MLFSTPTRPTTAITSNTSISDTPAVRDLAPSSLWAGTGGTVMGLGVGQGVTFDTISLDTTLITPHGPVQASPELVGRHLDGKGYGGNRKAGWGEFCKPATRFLLGSRMRRMARARADASGSGVFGRNHAPQRGAFAPCITIGSAAGATYVCAARAFTAMQTAEDARAGLRTHVVDIRTLYTPAGLGPDRTAAMVVSGLEDIESLRDDGFDDLGGEESQYSWKGYAFLLI